MVGTRLRRLRIARGLTQKDLAEPLYTNAYVSSIESGKKPGSPRALEHFARKLGVTAEELATGRPSDLEPRLEIRLAEARIALSWGRLDEAAGAFRSIAKEARRYHLPRIEARAEVGVGLFFERRGKPGDALDHYQRAEEILSGEPPTARVEAVAGKARCFHSLGDLRYEVHLLESLLGQIRRERLEDPEALANLHAGLLYAYVEAGLYEKAVESAAELQALAPRLSDPARAAQMHVNVARLYLAQGDAHRALRSLGHAEDAYRQLDLRTEIGYASLARGYVLTREGRLGEARSELEQALAIFEETGDEKDLTRTMEELGRVERLEGQTDRARELLERAIGILGTSDTPVLARVHRELGLVLLQVDPEAAEKNLKIAIELCKLGELPADAAVAYRGLGDLLNARGELEAASDAYRTGILGLEAHL
ncbi:MAG: tetratricopeptide repeat protein [Actinobacteria bacterium]|nr:tetratricopeptide repeat protein [Actinomycetota bacterium]